MATRRFTNTLLLLIFAALVGIWLRLPTVATALADEAVRAPVTGEYVGFAVDNAGFFILDPRKSRMYRYDRRGRVAQTYEIRAFGEDFKVNYGRGAAGE